MKILYFLMAFILLAASANASQWCQWDGTQGLECQSDARGYIKISGFPVKTPAIANARGYFKVTDTIPELTATQKFGAIVWEKVGNDINRTYTVVDKTTTENDEDTARALSLEMYVVLKWMVAQGVINPATAPTALKNAYLARQRIEE